MSHLLILGAGGHGRVVAFTARSTGLWSEIAFLDDRYPEIDAIDDCSVLGKFDAAPSLSKDYCDAAVGLGDGGARLDLIARLEQMGYRLPAVVHPTATVSQHAVVGAGTVIFAQCVIHPGADLGRGCIVNTAATVDHDCTIGDGVHLSPGVHLGGQVSIGDLAWLGVGADAKNGVHIGSRSVVGAGAAVVSDIPDGVTAVGVPARALSG